MADKFNKPNVVIPLAMSYDTRSEQSREYMEDAIDQRKINCFYDLIRNSTTGRSTLELVKRPGIRLYNSIQVTGTQRLVENIKDDTGSWIVSSDGSTTRVYDTGAGNPTSTITSTKLPSYLTNIIINGTPTGVLQLRATSGDPPAQDVYYATAANSWTQINDADFTGRTVVGKMESMDGYLFFLDSARRVYNFDLNSVTALTPTSFLEKQIKADVPCGLAKFKNEIIAFGQETAEIYRNVGNPSGSPLSVIKEKAWNVGIGLIGRPNAVASTSGGTTSYYCVVNDKLYFVGNGTGSQYGVSLYVYDGGVPQKISSGPIDRILSDINEGWMYSINKLGFYGHNALAIQFTAPGASTQKMFVYFPELNEWFEWTSTVFSPVNSGRVFLGAATSSANVFQWETNAAGTWQDYNAQAYTMSVQFRVPKTANNRDIMHWCALDADTTSSASNVTVEFSDNDYQSFSTGRTIDLNTQEKRINRCGSYKTPRVVRLSHSANAEFRARNFLARVE